MLQEGKQKLQLKQSQFDWVIMATDPEMFKTVQSEKEVLRVKIENSKGRI